MAQSNPQTAEVDAITAVTIEGFKSIAARTTLEIAPLTILAGANSSGKSSAMQPLLLLKQTLEAPYDPGPLELNASHIRYSATDQLLTKKKGGSKSFTVGLARSNGTYVSSTFQRRSATEFDLARTTFGISAPLEVSLVEEMETEDILKVLGMRLDRGLRAHVERDRCFFKARFEGSSPYRGRQVSLFVEADEQRDLFEAFEFIDPMTDSRPFASAIRKVIHVPGLRGNPERAYRTTAVEKEFPGTFEPYVASIVSSWQQASDSRLESLNNALRSLGLTWTIEAVRVAASAIELNVGRLPKRNGEKDLVNIADVGFGVSQALPVVVALLVAEPGRLVYTEQPEIHLHPRAQAAMAEILVEAANRGVRVVCETHSETLLLGIQTLVAQGKIDPKNVRLHWFERGKDGLTKVTTADLDKNGAYGDWPEDFGDVSLETQDRYLDAVQKRAKR